MRSRRSRISLRISACTVTSSAVVGSSATSSVGIERQRLGDHRPLALPARQLVRVGVDPPLRLRDLDELEQLDGPPAGQPAATSTGGCAASRRSGTRRCTRGSAPSSAPGRSSTRRDRGSSAGRARRARRSRGRRGGSSRARRRSSAAGPSAPGRWSTCPEPDSPTMASASPACRSNAALSTAGYHVPLTQKSTSRSRTSRTGGSLRRSPVRRLGSWSSRADPPVRRGARRWLLARWPRDRGGSPVVRPSADGGDRR